MKLFNDLHVEFRRENWHGLLEVGWFKKDDPALLTLQLLAKDGDNYFILVRIQIVRLVFEISLIRETK